MNIAFIHPSYPGSEGTGATHSATRVVDGLIERGHSVTVFCPSSPPESTRSSYDVIDLDLGSLFLRNFGSQLNKAIRSRKEQLQDFDILHSYLMRALPSIRDASINSDLSTVVTLNAYLGICPKNDLLYMDSENCSSHGLTKCIKCVANSTAREMKTPSTGSISNSLDKPYQMINQMRELNRVLDTEKHAHEIDAYRVPSSHVLRNYKKFGFPCDRMKVIPHPIDEDFFRERSVKDSNAPYKILYVGSLDHHKGADRLIPTLEKLEEISPGDYQMKIVGDGDLKPTLVSQLSESKVESNVELSGFVEYSDLPQVYSESDIFLYPGRWDEPLARVFLECLATETPIVTTDFGDIKSILRGSCRAVPADRLAQTIHKCVRNNELEEMSRAAKGRQQEFSAEKTLDSLEGLYSGLIP